MYLMVNVVDNEESGENEQLGWFGLVDFYEWLPDEALDGS